MIVRQEIRSIPIEKLRSLRDAWANVMAKDEYQTLAGFHGLPNPSFCQHHKREFLPWHRLYMRDMEKLLVAEGYTEGLPYWDWTDDTNVVDGFPLMCTEDIYTNAAGAEVANPLKLGKIKFESSEAVRNGSISADDFKALRTAVESANFEESFWRTPTAQGFSRMLESPHDSVHGWKRARKRVPLS